MEVLSVLSVIWDSVWGAVKLVVYSAGSMIASTLYLIQIGIVKVAEMAAALPGAVGRQFEATLPPLRAAANRLGAAVRTYSEGAKDAFSGYGQSAQKALEMAGAARHLAADLEKLAGVVREGGRGLRNHGNDAADAAAKLKELVQPLRAYRDLLLSLRGTNEYQAAYAAWQKDLDQINREITAKGAEWEARRDELRLAAAEKYFARIREIGQKAAAEAAEAQRKVDEAMRPEAQDVSRMQGPVPPPVPEVKLTNQQREALQLVDAFERLNGIKLDPFNQTLFVLQENVIQFAGMAGDAFASFFADILSGQEGAGKKLLAAFMGMLGKMLVQQGIFLIQAGIAHVLLSSVFPYSLFLRASDGYKAIAWGAVLTAAGGALMGAASALAQTNQAGAGASFQQAAPRPTSSQTQVIQVGAAGRAQSAGEAAATKPSQPAEVVLRVESNDSHIVKVVERNAGANGRLRVVMANG